MGQEPVSSMMVAAATVAERRSLVTMGVGYRFLAGELDVC
jgi:hypothetical protein